MCLLAVCVTLPVCAQSGLRPRGDVNCDWEFTIADVNFLIDIILDGDYTPASFNMYYADVNGDKELNLADVNAAIDGLMHGGLQPMPGPSGTLPILHVVTEGHRGVNGKEAEDYIRASWWLDANGKPGIEPVGSPGQPMGMVIKGHGNYTWTDCDKKSFRLKLDEKLPLMGMPASRHWVIKANAFQDKGKVEDALPFEIGNRMGMAWNPHIRPVELVLNGEYLGLYFLYEKIRVAKKRVNIVEQQNGEQDLYNVTGGWLLEINNYQETGNIIFTEGNGKPFWVMPHSPDSLSLEQREYITSVLERADSAIYLTDKNDRAWEKYIDIESLAVYYIVQEIVDNPEAFSGSCYMYKQRGLNTKLIFGPLWDCDHSYYRYNDHYEFNEFIYENIPENWFSRWIGEIARFPHFQERVRYHWQRFMQEVYPYMDAFMDDFVSEIELAGIADYQRWPQFDGRSIKARLNLYCKPSFHKKVAWLNSRWGSATTAVKSEPVSEAGWPR